MLYFLEINFNRILYILSLSIPLVTKQKKKEKKLILQDKSSAKGRYES